MVLQISGYISGTSPHIRSGAVSALSVLIYKDPEICLSSPELLSSVLSLLHTKSIEIIKVSLPLVPLKYVFFCFLLEFLTRHSVSAGCFGFCESFSLDIASSGLAESTAEPLI